jgi:F5/8 type C domain/PEP-CTERM motif
MKTLRSHLLAAVMAALTPAAFATDILVPISLGGATATQSTSFGGGAFPASNAIDGNFGNFTHTDIPETNATWTLTLAADTDFDIVRIWNRGDGCCGYRMSDLTVRAFDDVAGTNNIFTSAALNPGNVLNGPQRIDLSTPPLNARVLKISRAASDPNTHDGSVLSLGEVQLFDIQSVSLPLGTNLTQAGILAMTASQSTEYEFGGFPAILAIDGNPGNFTHTNTLDPAPLWEVNFGENMLFQTINLHNRGDGCCGSRLRDITVRVLDFSGATVFTSQLLNPENAGFAYPDGPGDIFLDLASLNGGSPITGARVQVSRTPDLDLSGTAGQGNNGEPATLSLGEVTVTGGSVPEPATAALLAFATAGLAARRRRG